MLDPNITWFNTDMSLPMLTACRNDKTDPKCMESVIDKPPSTHMPQLTVEVSEKPLPMRMNARSEIAEPPITWSAIDTISPISVLPKIDSPLPILTKRRIDTSDPNAPDS
jgi:hypothetical protein